MKDTFDLEKKILYALAFRKSKIFSSFPIIEKLLILPLKNNFTDMSNIFF